VPIDADSLNYEERLSHERLSPSSTPPLEASVKIWKHGGKVWWLDGPDDPTMRALRVEPASGEVRDGFSSRRVAAFEFMKAELTGAQPNPGENRKVTAPMR
jgi:hypothetical protein